MSVRNGPAYHSSIAFNVRIPNAASQGSLVWASGWSQLQLLLQFMYPSLWSESNDLLSSANRTAFSQHRSKGRELTQAGRQAGKGTRDSPMSLPTGASILLAAAAAAAPPPPPPCETAVLAIHPRPPSLLPPTIWSTHNICLEFLP